ncbi:bifunctional 4-hydroxy-2-oxoglutarate aldolase/2-dehydro-3-deoxy-phosphogluconate aldolase [Zobellella aerophila]|uniref:2-dehydro-3-deoxy-phosphogluconate aldolase n=1 Tax=Zobellella aerophila TaxID=870480 RepID=A0ABP6VM91_9GAMM
MLTQTTLATTLARFKIIPVIQINRVEQAPALARALVDNGLPVAEVTFRSEGAADAIRLMKQACPKLCIGAGTILNGAQAEAALAAGAEFMVAPGLNPTTVKACRSLGVPFIPGINNPSQVEQALELELSLLKFFPAEASGGINMVKSLLAPYQQISLMPTGGLTLENAGDYLTLPRVICCGGTWLTPTRLVDDGAMDLIGQNVRQVVARFAIDARA